MPTFGMTDQGFVPKRLADVLESIITKVKNIKDKDGNKPFINESADSEFGQFAQIISEEISICWEQAYLASQQFDPLNASGVPLRGLVQLNGITASDGSYTQITMSLGGTPGTVIPEGSIISSEDGKQKYSTVDTVTIGNSENVTVNANCTEKGPNEPATNTIIQIKTPVFGWRSATNTSTVSVGTNPDTDAQLHIKQERATSATSYRQVDAIISGLVRVDGVKYARLYVNPGLTTDANGITGKTLAPIVVGGTNEDIAEVLRLKCGTLDNFQGTTEVTYTGNLGDTQVVRFTRPKEIPVYISMNISQTEYGVVTDDTKEQIKKAIVEYAEYDQTGQYGFPPGADVILSRLYTPINSVSGFKVNSLQIGKAASSLSSSDIPIDFDEVATFSTDNIEVTVT